MLSVLTFQIVAIQNNIQAKTMFTNGDLWVWPSGSLMTPVLSTIQLNGNESVYKIVKRLTWYDNNDQVFLGFSVFALYINLATHRIQFYIFIWHAGQ